MGSLGLELTLDVAGLTSTLYNDVAAAEAAAISKPDKKTRIRIMYVPHDLDYKTF
jgi:hypothetical protein